MTTGIYSFNFTGFHQYEVVRYSPSGVQEWVTELAAPASAVQGVEPHLAVDPAGKPYLSGAVYGENGADYYVAGLDNAGLVLWERQLDGSAHQDDVQHSIFVDGAGSVYVTGRTVNVPTTRSSILTVKYEAAGMPDPADVFDANPDYTGSVKLPLPQASGAALLVGATWDNRARRVSAIGADGVSLLLLRVLLPPGADGPVHFRIADAGLRENQGSLWAVTDRSLLDASPAGGARDHSPEGPAELTVEPVQVGGARYGLALYRSPRNFDLFSFDEQQSKRPVTIMACLPGRLGAGFDSRAEVIIHVTRPLVFMLHGTFSDPNTWLGQPLFFASANPLNGFQRSGEPFDVMLGNFNPVFGAAGPALDSARYVLPQITDAVRYWSRRRGIAATQADVVTHSYGGVVLRVAATLQRDSGFSGSPLLNFRAETNWGHGPVHKLITIGGTHRGAAIVNHMAWMNLQTQGRLGELAGSHGITFDTGAMRDQFVASAAAQLLPKATPLPCHSIVGSGLLQHRTATEGLPWRLLLWYDTGTLPYHEGGPSISVFGDNIEGMRHLSNYVFNLSYFADSGDGGLNPNYDLTVGSRSAIGGLPRSAYSTTADYGSPAGQTTHVRQTTDPAIGRQIGFLLRKATNSVYFAPFPAFDPALSDAEGRLPELADPAWLSLKPSDFPSAQAAETAPVLITDALNGQVIPGQTLHVSLSWPGKTLASALLLSGTGEATESRFIDGANPEVNLTIPDAQPGSFPLTALTRAPDGSTGQVTLTLELRDAEAYVALAASPDTLTLDGSYLAPLKFFGQRADGTWRDLTRIPGLQVTSAAPGIAAVAAGPRVKAVFPGSTIISATLPGSGSVAVPVTVTGITPPAPAPPGSLTAVALATGEIRLTWTDGSSTEDGFEIQRRQGNGAFGPLVAVGANVTEHLDSDVTPEPTYGYRLRAVNAGGASAYTAEVRVNALPPAGGKLSVAKSVNFGRVKLGANRTKVLQLKNTDRKASLVVVIDPPAGAGFSSADTGLKTLPPHGKLRVTLRFDATLAGKKTGTLTFRSGDPKHRKTDVRLTAQAK